MGVGCGLKGATSLCIAVSFKLFRGHQTKEVLCQGTMDPVDIPRNVPRNISKQFGGYSAVVPCQLCDAAHTIQ